MDAKRFDTLTQFLVVAASSRRRVLGGLLRAVSAGVPVALAGTVAAKKKRKRKRKRKPRPAIRCAAGRIACNGQCRLPNLALCADDAECCSDQCLLQQCRPCHGRGCGSDEDCCPGVACEAGSCGGCVRTALSCQTSQECCFTQCNNGACLSMTGERCTTGVDCARCFASGLDPTVCLTACVGGTCTCPTECCFDTDCAPAEECRDGKCQLRPGG